jgi:hypothetical protein
LGLGGCGSLLPLTFKTSCSMCSVGRASHIIVSGSSPSPLVFFTIIISPWSYIYNPHFLACLYTSALFVNSMAERDRLHFIGPLLRRMAVYNCLRTDFDAQSITTRGSPFGVATLLHYVRSEKSFGSCAPSNYFHSSMFPENRLWCVFLFIWLYLYNQHDLSLIVCG